MPFYFLSTADPEADIKKRIPKMVLSKTKNVHENESPSTYTKQTAHIKGNDIIWAYSTRKSRKQRFRLKKNIVKPVIDR